MRNDMKGNQWARKRWWDWSFFDRIDTEVKAYWLGFALGDGSLYYQGNSLKFKLSCADKDVNHLAAFATDIGYTGAPVRTSTAGWEVWLFGDGFCKKLIPLGFDPLQGKSGRFVPKMPERLTRHFFRGLFDADGSVSKTGTVLTLCHASRSVIDAFGGELEKREICSGTVFRGHGTWQISAGGRYVSQRWANWMYNGATRFLERKAVRFLQAWQPANAARHLPCALSKLDLTSSS